MTMKSQDVVKHSVVAKPHLLGGRRSEVTCLEVVLKENMTDP